MATNTSEERRFLFTTDGSVNWGVIMGVILNWGVSIQEAEADRSSSSRLVWSTE